MPDYRTVIKRLEAAKAKLPKVVGAVMVEHATNNIRSGGFEGKPYTPRKAGSARDAGRQILIDTGRGLRSIRFSVTKPYVNVMMEVYMIAHNEGATISGTQNVREHERNPRNRRRHRVRSHNRQVNTKLPERPIIKNTPKLRAKLVAASTRLITKAFK